MMKRMLSAVMCLAMVLSLVTVLTPLKAQAADHGTFDTSLDYYLWLKEDDSGNYNYRWNADGTVKGNVIHLDIPSGGNCAFHFTDAGDGYYGIMCTKGSRYVDTDGNDNKEKRVLHQWSDDLDQDNQKFKFIPVDGEEDTYLIQVKNSGLYVGLNDYDEPEQHQKLVTADKDHAWEWVVVPTVPPLENNTLLPGVLDHEGYPEKGALTFMMNPVGSELGLSVNNDAKVVGNKVHQWIMGHVCKVTAEYIPAQDAYRLRSFDYFETTTNYWDSKDFVWDVDDQSKNDGAVIHVWDSEGDDKASTLWRFVAVPGEKDVYYIQNVNSRLFVSPEDNSDEDGVTLKQTSKKVPWEVHWLYGKDQSFYTYSENETPADINPGNWMSHLPDGMTLSQVNLPGTHDAAATRFYTSFSNFINEGVGQLLAQMLYVDEQLNVGVRAWDLRVSNKDANVTTDPTIIHGVDAAICHERGGRELHLSTVIETARLFLNSHPDETIVIKLSGQGDGNSLDVAKSLAQYILTDVDLSKDEKAAIAAGTMTYDDIGPRYPIFVPSKEQVNTQAPTLDQVRGKIVFLNGLGVPDSYESDLQEYQFRALGPNISPWVVNDLEKNPPKAAQKINGTCAYAQDVYDLADGKKKMEYVDGTFDDIKNHYWADYNYVLNFASGHDKIDTSKTIYKLLMDDSYLDQRSGSRNNTGILFCNEIDPLLTRRIYLSNFDGNGKPLPYAAVLPPVSQNDVSNTFQDVKKDAWYHDAVQWAADQGVMQGVSADKFDPDSPATRAMVVTMLWRMAGAPAAATGTDFTDVKEGSWYDQAVNWAAENGVVTGTSKTAFSPGDSVTREQLAAILYRYAQSKGQGFTGAWAFPLDYPDAAKVSEYAYEPMCWMTMNKIIQGMGNGQIAPQDTATRSQIAAMFMRFFDALSSAEKT